jgi:hypothetical protein
MHRIEKERWAVDWREALTAFLELIILTHGKDEGSD